MDIQEFLQTPGQFQVPKTINGFQGDQFQLDRRVGGGRVANVGLFQGTWLLRSGEQRPVAVKITTDEPSALEEEFIFINLLNSRIRADNTYNGALPPEVYQQPPEFIVKKNGEKQNAKALIMELVKGKPLDEMIREAGDNKLFTLEKASVVLSQIGLFNRKVLHPSGTTDVDSQSKNYFIPENGIGRLRKIDFDQKAPVDLPHLRDEYMAYVKLAYKLFTGQYSKSLDFSTGKIDLSKVIGGDIVGRRYVRALIEYAYAGFTQASSVEQLQKTYDDLVTAISMPQVASILDLEQLNSTLSRQLINLSSNGFFKQSETFIATILDTAEEKGMNLQLSLEARTKIEELGVVADEKTNDVVLCELAINAIKQKTEGHNNIVNASMLFASYSYEEGLKDLQQGALFAELTDPFNIQYRRYLAALPPLAKGENIDPMEKAAKVATYLYQGKVSEAAQFFEKESMTVSKSTQSDQLVESDQLKGASNPIKCLFYETRARYLLQQAATLEKQGELTGAYNSLREAQSSLGKMPDNLYLSSLLISEPEFSEQALNTKGKTLDERISKGESIDLLRQRLSQVEQELVDTRSKLKVAQKKERIFASWLGALLRDPKGLKIAREKGARPQDADNLLKYIEDQMKST